MHPTPRRSPSTSRRLKVGVSVFAVAVVVGVVVRGPMAAAQPVPPAGEATIVEPGGSRRIDSGGSARQFSLRLPDGAACPGDSANDGYRVQSYMVPAVVDPSTLEYGDDGPTPNSFGDGTTFRQPLYDVSTSPFVHAQTSDADSTDQAGFIVNIPPFSYAVYGPGELPAGRYRVGIACTLANRTVRYWGTDVDVTGAPDDEPAGIRWRWVGAVEGARRWRPWGGVAVAAAVVVLAALVGAPRLRQARRQSRPAATPLEDR